jgi:hypothetical protein
MVVFCFFGKGAVFNNFFNKQSMKARMHNED